jgi:hypothetical protein
MERYKIISVLIHLQTNSYVHGSFFLKVHLNGPLFEHLPNHTIIELIKFKVAYQLISLLFDLYLNFLIS